jgi:hypothetical protein
MNSIKNQNVLFRQLKVMQIDIFLKKVLNKFVNVIGNYSLYTALKNAEGVFTTLLFEGEHRNARFKVAFCYWFLTIYLI